MEESLRLLHRWKLDGSEGELRDLPPGETRGWPDENLIRILGTQEFPSAGRVGWLQEANLKVRSYALL